MSLADFRAASAFQGCDLTFNAFIMSAMRKAQGEDLDKLKEAWPAIYAELDARMRTNKGVLPSDVSEPQTRFHRQDDDEN